MFFKPAMALNNHKTSSHMSIDVGTIAIESHVSVWCRQNNGKEHPLTQGCRINNNTKLIANELFITIQNKYLIQTFLNCGANGTFIF